MLKVVPDDWLDRSVGESVLERVPYVQREADRTYMNGKAELWRDLNLRVKVFMGVQRMSVKVSPLLSCYGISFYPLIKSN